MRDQRLQISDILRNIDQSTLGNLDIPEFQRDFVWTPEKVKKLVDSLWRRYPIGSILLWSASYFSARNAQSAQSNKDWIIDGQQRITALAFLFGKKPYWWPDATSWNRAIERFDVLVNLKNKKDRLEFGLPNPIRKVSSEWISVRKILNSNNLAELAEEIKQKLPDQSFTEIHEKLHSINKIKEFPIYEIIVDHELEDVAEIFGRLNSAGTRVRESDIITALVASKQVGWVRGSFNKYLKDLETRGFDLDPSVLIRTLGIILSDGTARLKDISKEKWDPSPHFDECWTKTKDAVSYIIKNLNQYGILSSDILPSYNALIPLFILYSKFPSNFDFKKGLRWFLLATLDGRYSGSSVTTLDQDSKAIYNSASFEDALSKLIISVKDQSEFSNTDFLGSYKDESMQLIIYLTVFSNKAMDWVNQDIRIGYDRSVNGLNEGFRPEWHHFFPKKILRENSIEESEINSIANIAVLNERANRSFASMFPSDYLAKFNVSKDRLKEQCFPEDMDYSTVRGYKDFLAKRSELLACAANQFMRNLS